LLLLGKSSRMQRKCVSLVKRQKVADCLIRSLLATIGGGGGGGAPTTAGTTGTTVLTPTEQQQ
jgi:hypothetical protein